MEFRIIKVLLYIYMILSLIYIGSVSFANGRKITMDSKEVEEKILQG